MEIDPENYLKQRNYSNSPYIKNFQQNNNLYKNIQHSSQNLFSIVTDSDALEDESDNIELIEYKKKLNEKNMIIEKLKLQIENLYAKVGKEKHENNLKQKANEKLREKISYLNTKIKTKPQVLRNNISGKNMIPFDIDMDMDTDDNIYYENNYKNSNNGERTFSTKNYKIKNRIRNNFNDNEEIQYYNNNINNNNNKSHANNNEIINEYKYKINFLSNKIDELQNDLLQKKRIIKKLNYENKNLKFQLKEMENKYNIVYENCNLMAMSSLQNQKSININNYKIRNNSKNNLNYNDIKLFDKKNLTHNNFYAPANKKNTTISNLGEETLSNDIQQLNMKNTIQKENNNKNYTNEIKILKLKYNKFFNEYNQIKEYCNKLKKENQIYISEKKKLVNTINLLTNENKNLESLLSKANKDMYSLMNKDNHYLENLGNSGDIKNKNNINNNIGKENIIENNKSENIINDLTNELKNKNEKIKEQESTINNLNKKIQDISKKNNLEIKKENEKPKSVSLISDEEDDDNCQDRFDKNYNNDSTKNNKGYAKLYSKFTKKSELLTQKEKEYSLLLEKLGNMEKETKEKESKILELNNIIKEKNIKIEELDKSKEEYTKIKNEIKNINEKSEKKDELLKEKDDIISLDKLKIN